MPNELTLQWDMRPHQITEHICTSYKGCKYKNEAKMWATHQRKSKESSNILPYLISCFGFQPRNKFHPTEVTKTKPVETWQTSSSAAAAAAEKLINPKCKITTLNQTHHPLIAKLGDVVPYNSRLLNACTDPSSKAQKRGGCFPVSSQLYTSSEHV